MAGAGVRLALSGCIGVAKARSWATAGVPLTTRVLRVNTEDHSYLKAIARLAALIEEARRRGDADAETAALATARPDARRSVRTVNILRVQASGLLLFANSETGKGRQMQTNPRAALCFYWRLLSYQAIVEGAVTMLSEAEADAYWSDLPRESSLGHWASDQTGQDLSPSELRRNMREFRQQFDWQSVPRAPAWRAFEIEPDRIDFWPTGWQRLRARECYSRSADGLWTESTDNP